REWSRRTSFNLRMVSLFCGNGSLDLKVDFGGETYFKWSPAATAALRAVPIRCRSLFRTTTVKLIGFSSEHRSASLRNRDRHQFGTLIAIPRNPHPIAQVRAERHAAPQVVIAFHLLAP